MKKKTRTHIDVFKLRSGNMLPTYFAALLAFKSLKNYVQNLEDKIKVENKTLKVKLNFRDELLFLPNFSLN
jgi:hypothetical protein